MSVKLFPTSIVDDFFEQPDTIRNYALKQEYKKCDVGFFPGKRTKCLSEINPTYHDYSCRKFMGLFYDFDLAPAKWNISTYFQIIEPLDTDIANQAWVHIDGNSILAGVVYLSPDADLNSGTSIYRGKPNCQLDMEIDERKPFHKDNVFNDNYVKKLTDHSDMFEETIAVKNVYNRLVAYDANSFHRATSHYSPSFRLTQIFFVTEMEVSTPPIRRMNNVWWPLVERTLI